jgi:adhesin/invasin
VATVTIQVSQAVELVPGGTQMLSVVPKDAKGNTLIDRITTWTSSDDSKVTVQAGLVTGVAIGAATVTASVEGHTATVDVRVKNGAVVSPSGTTFTTLNGAVTVAVPSGAVSQTTNFTVEPAASAPANPRLLPGTAFDFGPNGATFPQPVTLTIKYNPANVASDSPESGLQLYEVVGSAWRVVPGSTVNLTDKTVSGNVSHFSTYGVMMQPKVETVTIGTDLTPIAVVTTRQLTATLKDNEGTTLTRPVTWASSDPTILSVDASSGLVTAKALGTVTVTASSEGKSGTASLTVVPGPPSKLVGFAGNNQSVAAGTAVPTPPSVLITDAGNNPISGVAVVFTVGTGGGTVVGGNATTNSSGIAAVTSWTLGTVAGPNSLVATSPAVAGASFTFNAAGGVGPPAIVVAFAGNNQTATAGGNVATKPAVKVTDANGNFIAGFPVTFAVASGGGTVTGASVVTDASGIATVGNWKLGTTVGPQTLTATASGLTGSPITFSVNAVAPVASKIAGFAGNNQTARPGGPVATPPSVIVTDPADIPVAGVTVTFAVTSGGGSVTGATAVTNASGIAAVGSWTVGETPGPNTMTASSGTLTGSPVTFNATGVPNVMTAWAGNNQTTRPGGQVPVRPAVRISDVNGNPVAGIAVTFAVASGGGSVTAENQISNTDGLATVGTWTLGPNPGPNSLTASTTGASGSPITFNATAVPNIMTAYVGNNQTARPGTAVATPPTVRVTDINGVPVAGVPVTFTVASGGGSVTGANVNTNADGYAAVGSWILGPSLGPNSLTVTAPVDGSPITFNATGAQPPPASMVINGGNDQTASAGQPVPIAPSVKVTDASGAGVPGVVVVFSVRSGGGTITGPNATTDASGVATLGSWVLGLGGNSLFASIPGATVSGDPLVFVALGTAEVQIVTFGDSNTDLGFQGTDPSPKVGSYVSSTNPAIKLSSSAPNSGLQLAGKIEARWKQNRSKTIKAVNHAISGTSTGTGRSILFAPNALEQVAGVSRFKGEVLGDAYPWNGGEQRNEFYPDGAIQRVQAFKPRASSDFAYISMGTNDLGEGTSTTTIRNNLEIMIDEWISRGLPASRLMITTLPPRRAGTESARVPDLNAKIRTLAQAKGIRLIDISSFVSNDDGLTWKSAAMHVTNDDIHYSEAVRDWIADQVVSIMLAMNPP